MQRLDLPAYQIFVGPCLSAWKRFWETRNYSRLAVLVDENTRRSCLPLLEPYLPADAVLIEIEAGETHKNLNTCRFIWEEMLRHELDRKALLLNLGGGVIGDMGGFCASTYKRGIHFVQMPTTLLAQVDASIGGKLGVDLAYVKNSVGLFADPQAVFADPAFLQTLPFDELRSGFAEIVKHALIADRGLWEELQEIDLHADTDWSRWLLPSLRIKKQIVENDPYEQGPRKALNFGHTIGHALESWALEGRQAVLHGEAVAAGMICEAFLSWKAGLLHERTLAQVIGFLQPRFPSLVAEPGTFDRLLALMRLDKKNEAGQIRFALIGPIGQCVVDQTCSDDRIAESLEYYRTKTRSAD